MKSRAEEWPLIERTDAGSWRELSSRMNIGSNRTKRTTIAQDEFALHLRAHQIGFRAQARLSGSGVTPKTGKANSWIFDFWLEKEAILVEIQGGIWIKGGGAHSHPLDIMRNMRKQNDAALLGLTLLQFTPQEVKSGHAIDFTRKIISLKEQKS